MAACKQTQSKFWKTECVLMGSRHKTKYADTQLQLESENEIVKKVKNTKDIKIIQKIQPKSTIFLKLKTIGSHLK